MARRFGTDVIVTPLPLRRLRLLRIQGAQYKMSTDRHRCPVTDYVNLAVFSSDRYHPIDFSFVLGPQPDEGRAVPKAAGATPPDITQFSSHHNHPEDFPFALCPQPDEGRTVPKAAGATPPDITQQFRDWITGQDFTCLGARSSLRRDVLFIESFGSPFGNEAASELYPRLESFVLNQLSPQESFTSFVAIFNSPTDLTELAFEQKLWELLSGLHERDRGQYQWSPEVSSDPTSPHFGFSIAERALFIVGMHGGSSRVSRRFPQPAIAFNAHTQFKRLRADGAYAGLQRQVRKREIELQGCTNPNLTDHGQDTEAKQYSGREVPADWVAPFTPAPPSHKGPPNNLEED